MRTRILCLNGIGSPERIRYAYNKAQEIKGNLIIFLNKVLSGTSDFSDIKGISKDYFADFLIGKKTLPRKFIHFFLDLISIEDHPLPPRSSLNDLYETFRQDTDFIILLKKQYCTSDIIIGNEAFWCTFYKEIKASSQENVRNIFSILSILSKANHCKIWNNFSAEIIWQKAFEVYGMNNSTIDRIGQWMHFLNEFKENTDICLCLLENKTAINPLNRKTEKLLIRLLPILFFNGYSDFNGLIRFLNSNSVSDPRDIAITSGFIHFLINLFVKSPDDLIAIIKLFIETQNYFRRFILLEKSKSKINYLKSLIIKVIQIKKEIPDKDSKLFNRELLTTIYIISQNKDKVVYSEKDIKKQLDKYYGDFHEKLFIGFFVKYEVPWYFVRNLLTLSNNEIKILFNLLAGKNFESLIDPEFPVTHKDVHVFMNFDRYSVRVSDTFIHTGLFWAKFVNFKFHQNILNALKQYLTYNLPIRQFIDNYNFWMDVFKFIKKHELLIQQAQIGPLLDYITYQRFRVNAGANFQINRVSFNRVLIDMEEWHINLRRQRNFDQTENITSWEGTTINDFVYKTNSLVYSIIQLKSKEDLFTEGKEMKNCVFGYLRSCITGYCSIWSLREEREGITKRLATIELQNSTIVQVRKKTNILPGNLEKTKIHIWAKEEGLKERYLI